MPHTRVGVRTCLTLVFVIALVFLWLSTCRTADAPDGHDGEAQDPLPSRRSTIVRSPYIYRLEKEEEFSFHFVNAPIVTEQEESIKAFWDQPCYRFFHWDPSPIKFDMAQVRDTYTFLYDVVQKDGPFDGVMGFSQGCVASIAFMLHHADTHPDDLPDALFRFAILFSSPNLPTIDGDGSTVEWTGKISVPSLHITGSADTAWHEGAKLMLEKNCEQGSATMVVHDGGHLIPKDKPTVDKIIQAIKNLLRNVDAV